MGLDGDRRERASGDCNNLEEGKGRQYKKSILREFWIWKGRDNKEVGDTVEQEKTKKKA